MAAPVLADIPIRWPRSVLLATDGSPSADAAVRSARALERRTEAAVDIAAVYAPAIPVPAVAGRSAIDRCATSDRNAIAAMLRDVRWQLTHVLGEARYLRDWPLTLEVGDAGTAIVRAAVHRGADLTIIGIGADQPHSRHFGTHTAIAVVRNSASPVYAAVPGCEVPSRAIVLAVDGQLHPPTFRAAVACLIPGGRLWIAAANSPAPLQCDLDTIGTRALAMRICGRRWTARLDEIEIMRVQMGGDIVHNVLQLARDTRAHLIAVPNYGDPGPIRAFLPNPADSLLLGARCSVLVVPDRANDETAAALGNDSANGTEIER